MKNIIFFFLCIFFATSCTKESFTETETLQTEEPIDSMVTVVVQLYSDYTEMDSTSIHFNETGYCLFMMDEWNLNGIFVDTQEEIDARTNMNLDIFELEIGSPVRFSSASKVYHLHRDSIFTDSLFINDIVYSYFGFGSDIDSVTTTHKIKISLYSGIQDAETVSKLSEIESDLIAPNFTNEYIGLQFNSIPTEAEYIINFDATPQLYDVSLNADFSIVLTNNSLQVSATRSDNGEVFDTRFINF